MTPMEEAAQLWLQTLSETDPEFVSLRAELQAAHPDLTARQVTLLTWTWLHLAATELLAATEATNPGSSHEQ